MKCNYCGEQLQEGATTCTVCGANVAPTGTANQATQSPVRQTHENTSGLTQLTKWCIVVGSLAIIAALAIPMYEYHYEYGLLVDETTTIYGFQMYIFTVPLALGALLSLVFLYRQSFGTKKGGWSALVGLAAVGAGVFLRGQAGPSSESIEAGVTSLDGETSTTTLGTIDASVEPLVGIDVLQLGGLILLAGGILMLYYLRKYPSRPTGR